MKTEELIEHLSAEAGKGWRYKPSTSWIPMWGGAAVTAALFGWRFHMASHAYGVFPDWPLAWRVPVLLIFALMLFRLVVRLSRPALAWRVRLQPLLLIPIGLFSVALIRIIWAHPQDRWDMLMGRSASSCSASIFLLSLPLLFGGVLVARQWALTRPELTGAMLGWSSASLTAMIYTLHCTETEPAFVLVWYGLAVLLSGALGAYLGRRYLRC
ncbi:MAG: DUF1109 domain-containing protein [Alphaproteobacteria bacterium]|nr:DUF1109 domain-containing protein [Alphaproteobacteria bacterium]